MSYRTPYSDDNSAPAPRGFYASLNATPASVRFFLSVCAMLSVTLTQWGVARCSEPDTVLVAARATVVQHTAVREYPCRTNGGTPCEEPVPPQVHFAHDGKVYVWRVASDWELAPFRHWGCYWVRVAPPRALPVRVVGVAPSEACP